jgi:hypothetical protein
MPSKGEFCDTPNGRGKITDRNLLTRKVTVTFENGNSSTFAVDEITCSDNDRRPNRNSKNGENRKDEEKECANPQRKQRNQNHRKPADNNAPEKGNHSK